MMNGRRWRSDLAVLALTALGATLAAACGGGSSGSGGGSGLAFRVLWEQPATSGLVAGTGDPVYDFGSTIPGAVNTVRITLEPLTPTDPPSCCIAVERGTETFANRAIVLDDVAPGDANIKIYGYPTDFAPADGILRRCPTDPPTAGSECDTTRSALPSFASNGKDVAVLAGERTDAGDIQIYSVPFLADLDPAPGAVVTGPGLPISLAVVDAINPVAEGELGLTVAAGTPPVLTPVSMSPGVPCDEHVASPATPCTTEADLDVSGVLLTGTAAPVPPGQAYITVTAIRAGAPERSLTYGYEVTVEAPSPTTTSLPTASSTTVTSTSITTVSSTTITSTTTTTLGSVACVIQLGITNTVDVAGITIDVDYQTVAGDFVGSGAAVSCRVNPALGAIGAFNDADAARQLTLGVLAANDFSGPIVLGDCDLVATDPPAPSDFGVVLREAYDAGLTPQAAAAAVVGVTCAP